LDKPVVCFVHEIFYSCIEFVSWNGMPSKEVK
jgi:hypothetical protein